MIAEEIKFNVAAVGMDLFNTAPKATSQLKNLVEVVRSPKVSIVSQEVDETVIEADDEYSPERERSGYNSKKKLTLMSK